MAGISSKAAGKGLDCGCGNKKGYNGNEIQAKEFSDGSGLDVYDFNARTYDQQIGRFIQVDALADEPEQVDKSPYAYAWNNPIKLTDPDGNCPRCLKALAKTVVKSVVKGKVDLGEVYDIVDNARVLLSPSSTGVERVEAGFNLVSPVSTKELKAGKKLLEGASDTKKAAKGGVYSLKDADDKVVRTGRTKDLDKRKDQHATGKDTKDLKFEEEYRTDNYSEQRGLEKVVYDKNPQAQSSNGGLNKIKPISDKNKNKTTYENAANDYIKRNGGG
jgi:RHS repeat-associated protein